MTATMTTPAIPAASRQHPTLWGLTPTALHDRFWAARGVQVVRQGERSSIVAGAELFLLSDPRTLVLFRLRDLVSLVSWMRPDLLLVRVKSRRLGGYRESVVTDAEGRLERFQRIYSTADTFLTRVAFTNDPDLAQAWQTAATPEEGWRRLRHQIPRHRRETSRVGGLIYNRASDSEVAAFVRDLINFWENPAATIPRARKTGEKAWQDASAPAQESLRTVGTVWIGAGRTVPANTPIIGPAALWDDPAARPATTDIRWQEIEPSEAFIRPARVRRLSSLQRGSKRLFDIAFAAAALAFTLPLYPPILLAIWLEDGRPFFFAHKRETLGGREFGCLKFRSMRRDAEKIKRELMAKNLADGPQFFMEKDPRLTRVGNFLRNTNLDELPQFWNVLLGDMTVVGPRPSPRSENQYCPPWREARLSVRPGITGLWQVKRTRRRGLDFQEWIKFDIQYVENMSWKLDLYIIWQTFKVLIRGVLKR